MVDEKTKKKFMEELEKTGNVFVSCKRVNIHRSTFYRWRQKSKRFKKTAEELISRGKEDGVDIAEYALMSAVKEKDLSAIKYFLGHNSEIYKNKTIVVHEKIGPIKEELRKGLDEQLMERDAKVKKDQEIWDKLYRKPEKEDEVSSPYSKLIIPKEKIVLGKKKKPNSENK